MKIQIYQKQKAGQIFEFFNESNSIHKETERIF